MATTPKPVSSAGKAEQSKQVPPTKEEKALPKPTEAEAKKSNPAPAPKSQVTSQKAPPIEKPPVPQPPQEKLSTPQKESTTTTKPEQPDQPKEQPQQSLTPPTLESLYQEIQSLKTLALHHSNLISNLQEALSRKRKPVSSNGKIQIKDKATGKVYPSKNNAYQSLLKSGDLKHLVDKGIFGTEPSKNTFGWYVLEREYPDRFEEIKEA